MLYKWCKHHLCLPYEYTFQISKCISDRLKLHIGFLSNVLNIEVEINVPNDQLD